MGGMSSTTSTSPATSRSTAVKAQLFRGLADPSRLSVLEELRAGPSTVSDLVAATGLSQPSVSMHLACLWECGLVERERQGRFVEYRIADERVNALLEAGDGLLLEVGQLVYICTRYREADPPVGHARTKHSR